MAHGTNDHGDPDWSTNSAPVPQSVHDPVPVRVPGINVRHLGDQIREWTETAFRAVAGRDTVWYDIGLTVVPHAAGVDPGTGAMGFQLKTVYVLTVFMPRVLIGKAPYSSAQIIQNDFPGQGDIINAVRDAVNDLRIQKSNDLRGPRDRFTTEDLI